jgi:hypothetical protein
MPGGPGNGRKVAGEADMLVRAAAAVVVTGAVVRILPPLSPGAILSISENLETFKGKPVVDWTGAAKPADFDRKVFRVRIDYDEAEEGVSFAEKLAGLFEADGADRIESLVLGAWQGDDTSTDSGDIVEALVSGRERLPRLRNLFFGDIMSEECEISWVVQSDLSPLLGAYERLEHLTVRGGEGLTFGTLRHDHLKELIVQAGGLPPSVVQEVAAAQLPALQHLELWLGEPNYGGDATVEDLAPLLRADKFPKLRYLGLKDSVIQDDIAGVVAIAPILDRLEVLDLSMGTLTDVGGKALLASPKIRKLKKLDLHHHYMSDAMVEQFEALNIDVDVSEQEKGDEDDRFISVSE